MKQKTEKNFLKINERGLPWWRSGWESACQCRGHWFEPWSGKIPHAAERLGPWATIAEPARLEPVLCNKRGCDSERPAHRDEEWPPLAATGESPCTETKTQHSHKSINQSINQSMKEKKLVVSKDQQNWQNSRLAHKKRRQQTNKVRNEDTIDPTEIKSIIREYYKQSYSSQIRQFS